MLIMATKLEDYKDAKTFKGRVRCEEDWYSLTLGPEFGDYFREAVQAVDSDVSFVEKPHISLIKSESPCRKIEKFGRAFVNEIVEFKIHELLQYENGRHIWVNCYSERLCEIREYFNLPVFRQDKQFRVNFHSTLARLNTSREALQRPQYRITPATYIDVETLMQHI